MPSAPLAARRDRPPLDPVLRTDAPATPKATATHRTHQRKPSNMIDGSTGGDPTSVVRPDDPGGARIEIYPDLEAQVVRLVNAERARHGCRALQVDPRLVRSARAHSAEMAASGRFGHSSPDGTTPWERMAAAGYANSGAETIARGYQTAEEVVLGWMADAKDRATLLNCRLVATGVGVSMGDGGPWWTEDFGYS